MCFVVVVQILEAVSKAIRRIGFCLSLSSVSKLKRMVASNARELGSMSLCSGQCTVGDPLRRRWGVPYLLCKDAYLW
jgi:hypothetical protein